MRRLRYFWVPVGLLALLVVAPMAYLATSTTADAVLDERQQTRPPCPDAEVRIHPSEVHLAPGVVQHQNWIDFPVPKRFGGYYALCLDGRELERGGGVLDFSSGYARFHVATRSIDLYWLGGNLDALRDPNRWELRLACAGNFKCE